MSSLGERTATHDGQIVRAWRPPGFDLSTAGTVVYVHGYYTTVDDAWTEHQLPTQFARSRQNALFAAVAGPSSRGEQVAWPRLGAVRDELAVMIGLRPPGPVVVVAHSGGYRTVASWIRAGDAIDQVTLLDALYADVTDFTRWIGDSASPRRTMNVVVCREGAPRSLAGVMLAALRDQRGVDVAHRDGVPERYEDFTSQQRRARLLHIVANQTHMGLVHEGAVLPVMLRRSPLPLVAKQVASSGGIQ
jgi:hypothetical protein